MSSIKGNIILNGINTLTGLLFPIITFPYAARVLMPEGIGTINFLNGIVGYIVLLTSLGIPLYAVKEIAKCRDNIALRNKVTIEILILSFILSLIGYVAVWLLAKFIPEIHRQASIFYVLSLTIVFTTIGVNWFYQAIEDFKFITIRALIVRTIAAAALFIFVKTPDDLTAYAFIIVGSTVGNNLINFIHLRKHLTFPIKEITRSGVLRHLRPTMILFVFNLIVSLYVSLNAVMLGFISGETEVGYFTAGTKISHIGLTIIASIGTVLLPRCSNLLAQGDTEGFNAIINKSLQLVLGLALPITVGLMILCKPITLLFCGSDYYPSIIILLLNAPVILFIGLTNLIGIQILYPKDKTKIVLWSVGIGALLNLILNFILLPPYGALGAAIATLVAEFGVLLIQYVKGKKELPFNLSNIFNAKFLIATIAMGLFVWLTLFIPTSDLWHTTLGIATGIATYIIALIFIKEPLFAEMRGIILSQISNAKTI